MSWRDIMRRVLPPISGISPEITSQYGAVKGRTPPATIPHRGVDFNYPIGQTGINLKNPELRSPVAGVVTTNPGEGTVGRIAIRDANGLYHEILHTHTQYVKRGDLVGVGQPIGRMGTAGTGQHHVHYQLKDSADQAINPADFWDKLSAAKTDPGQPAYLREYQQYLRGTGANAGNGYGNGPSTTNMTASGVSAAASNQATPLYARQTAPRLARRIAGQSSSVFDGGATAVPAVPQNDVFFPNRHNFPGDRFGDWISRLPTNDPPKPDLPAWMRDLGEIPRDADRKPVPYLGRRVADKPEPSTFDEGTSAVPFVPFNEVLSSDRPSSLDSRFGNWTASPGGSTPRNPNLALPPAESGMPSGIFNDKPIPLWTTPPPTRGSTDFSEAPGNGTKPMRYVSRRDGNPPPASVADTGAPAAQFVLPDQLNDSSSGGTDWAAALAGLASPPQRRNTFVSGNDALSRAGGGGSSSRPGQSQGPTASALLEYIQHLNQLSANTPQGPIFERGAEGASLAPSDSSIPMGLPGRLAALAGIDPDNPDRSVPPPGGLLALLLAGQQRR